MFGLNLLPLFHILVLISGLSVANASSPTLADYSTSTAPLFIQYVAVKYGIEYEPFRKTLYCESHYYADAVGDKGTSFGIAQIHLSAHKDISKEQALNPLWAIEWSAQQFALGNAEIWSCYKGHDTS